MTEKLRTKYQTTLPECVFDHLGKLTPEQLDGDVLERLSHIREQMTELAREAGAGATKLGEYERQLETLIVRPQPDELRVPPIRQVQPASPSTKRMARQRRFLKA